MTTKCPCCGAPTPDMRAPRANFEENILYWNGHRVPLTRRLLRLADILARRYTHTIATDAIVEAMWGDAEGDYAETNIKVGVTQLRNKLRPVGLEIINTWGIGYRMAETSKTERMPQTQGEQAHAQA